MVSIPVGAVSSLTRTVSQRAKSLPDLTTRFQGLAAAPDHPTCVCGGLANLRVCATHARKRFLDAWVPATRAGCLVPDSSPFRESA